MLITQCIQTMTIPTHVYFHHTTGSHTNSLLQAITRRISLGRIRGWFTILLHYFQGQQMMHHSHTMQTHVIVQILRDVCRHFPDQRPFGCGHHEGFMSAHLVVKLVIKGKSHETHSKHSAPEQRVQPLVPPKWFTAWVVQLWTCRFSWLSRPRNRGLWHVRSHNKPFWLPRPQRICTLFLACLTRFEMTSTYKRLHSPSDPWPSQKIHDSL